MCDLRGWLDAGVPLSLGSDSQVCRHWSQEIRTLEYGQRGALRQRNIAADPDCFDGSTAARLFDAVQRGGGAACGRHATGLTVGARADFVVLDTTAPGLLGVPATHVLDALVFATDGAAIDAVFVGGRPVVERGRHLQADAIAQHFERTMAELWPPA